MQTSNSDASTTKTRIAKVSVVMVTYNHLRYIEQAITSVLSQEFHGAFELIIGDDCSDDGTSEIVRGFHDRHPGIIKLISSANNVGADANFRRCIDACSGEFIAFCEGDDYWHDPAKLQTQVRLLQSDEAIGAVHSDYSHLVFLYGRWRALPAFHAYYRTEIPSGKVFLQLLQGNFIQTCTVMARTSLVRAFQEASSRNTNSYLVGDWPLYLSISTSARIEYIKAPLATYRKNRGSATNKGQTNDILRAENSLQMISDFCLEYSVPDYLRLQAHDSVMRQILYMASISANTSVFEKYWHEIYLREPDYLDTFKFRLVRFIVKTRGLRNLYCEYKRVIDNIRYWKRYR